MSDNERAREKLVSRAETQRRREQREDRDRVIRPRGGIEGSWIMDYNQLLACKLCTEDFGLKTLD